ncbi:fimbrial protein [Burkholderia lata]|uniref:Fimbria adhesin protein n=1 Tax=Burkholderia lata (strain ATCC 17760 / DSM 23089 / LMG 22485 / NCIMB 9086 / R18194 / 383) TaxID=482957 RepID=A0A6P2U8U3_BURL3|nr:fimbrial protein [Burkholderia lata]VWC65364.1 fimbria adhesin protein [Burkholderia lata]
MRQIILAVVLFGAAVSPAMSAHPTGCTIRDTNLGHLISDDKPAVYTMNGYATPEFNPSVPVGTVLDTREILVTGPRLTVLCNIHNVLNGRLNDVTEPVYNTYATSVKGVGVRLRYGGNATSGWWPYGFERATQMIVTSPSPIVVEFVKIGPITSQGALWGELGGIWVGTRYGYFQFVSFQITGSILIKPKVPTCSVATKKIDVQLSPSGGFTTRDFNGVGSTTPERDFSIKLDCAGGDEGTSTNAYVTLTDNTNPGNLSNQLSLSPDSEAAGFAVQVLKSGTPLNFGPDSSAAGNPNQWKAGNIQQGAGVFTIPLTARYIQTAAKVKGGTANAIATFTMSYQ